MDIPERLQRYALPEPPDSSGLADLFESSISFLELREANITVPMYVTLWRSVLRPSNFVLYVQGPTGTYKTYTVLSLLQHFGRGHTNKNLALADSTSVGLEIEANGVGDALLLIDDFKGFTNTKSIDVITAFIQAIGNGSGRTRGNADLNHRKGKPPRGTVVITAEEDLPGSDSTFCRTLSVRFSTLTNATETRRRLEQWRSERGEGASALMAAYLRHLATDYIGLLARFDRLTEAWLRVLSGELGEIHQRLVSTVSELLASFELFLDFAVLMCGISEVRKAELLGLSREVLVQVVSAQANLRVDFDPVDRALSLTTQSLASMAVHVCDFHDETLWPGPGFGWKTPSAESNWIPNSPKVGWVDRDKGLLYLLPDSWYRAIKSGSAAEANLLPGKSTLIERLSESGHLSRGSEIDRPWLLRVSVGTSRPRVIAIRLDSLGLAVKDCPKESDAMSQEFSDWSNGPGQSDGSDFSDTEFKSGASLH